MLNFTVEKATVTVKADDKYAAMGTSLPEPAYTSTGLAAADKNLLEVD